VRVALLHTKDSPRAKYLLDCFAKGVAAAGDTPFWLTHEANLSAELQTADVAVQICGANRHYHNDVGRLRVDAETIMRQQKKRIIVIDSGFVKNQSELELVDPNKRFFDLQNPATYPAADRRTYYQIGYDGIKSRAACYNAKSPANRWRALGVVIQPWRTYGQHILLLGQPKHGLSSQHLDIFHWYRDVVKTIRRHSSRLIVFRHHPRVAKSKRRLEIDQRQIKKHLKSLDNLRFSRADRVEDDLRQALATVSLTSNAAVTSVLCGVPTFAMDSGCMAYEVCNHDLALLEKPQMPDRQQWCFDLAYAQWNPAEMREGLPWRHLKPHATKSSS
jgi:hypothetical protein